jgi:hypothetical protein
MREIRCAFNMTLGRPGKAKDKRRSSLTNLSKFYTALTFCCKPLN